MVDEEVRTYPLSLEETENGITVSIPWVQRHANGAVIARVHMYSPKHAAGELLLSESDLIALDQDERPLRTQVRRFWGYGALADITPAHLQTARFDVGFRADLAATGGHCGVSIALIRTFRPGEGPKAVGGPWVFKFRIADDAEVAAAIKAEAARQDATRQEAAQREAAQREATERDAAQREAARLARARAEAERAGPLRAMVDSQAALEPRRETLEGPLRASRIEAEEYGAGADRIRRPGRFGRPERAGREEARREPVQSALESADQEASTRRAAHAPGPPRGRLPRGGAGPDRQAAEAAIMGPAQSALEATGEGAASVAASDAAEAADISPPATRRRAPRTASRRGTRTAGAAKADQTLSSPPETTGEPDQPA